MERESERERQIMAQRWKHKIDVVGSLTTTVKKIHIINIDLILHKDRFVGNAQGIFTAASQTLRAATSKLYTNDLAALRSKGTFFYFNPSAQEFVLTFCDEDNNVLGELHAAPFTGAANPGRGRAGTWSKLE